ncbi:hypothetical protein [Actinacidiphila epipremni]|uniref:Uncharacterized protein n=1 Tax=Actinacidiphila epipremni TaxID=2053013 RepID=A0ABX1A489_9ACTN|nr:hypothetical protein [Actinacidiphila epipremni]NJP48398.1 hypothetical protein [Actinacidiphila epipremni]
MSTATIELGRFLTITGRRLQEGESAPEMFSGAVDAAWHAMLGTAGYPAFCERTAGREIRHAANAGMGPIGWVGAYEEAYGPLPEIWFTDAEGRVDREAMARYRATGRVVAEWDCSPTTGDEDEIAPPADRR